MIPEDTKAAIVEDVSEEDYNSEEEAKNKEAEMIDTKKDMTVQAVANEIFE